MIACVRTTLDIHDPLLAEAKRRAAERGVRLADLVNDALLALLNARGDGGDASAAEPYRMGTFKGTGPARGFDLYSNADAQEFLDEEHRRPDGTLDLDKLR